MTLPEALACAALLTGMPEQPVSITVIPSAPTPAACGATPCQAMTFALGQRIFIRGAALESKPHLLVHEACHVLQWSNGRGQAAESELEKECDAAATAAAGGACAPAAQPAAGQQDAMIAPPAAEKKPTLR